MRQSAIRNIYKIKAVLFLLLRSCSQNACLTTGGDYGQSDPGQHCLSSNCHKVTFIVFEPIFEERQWVYSLFFIFACLCFHPYFYSFIRLPVLPSADDRHMTTVFVYRTLFYKDYFKQT